MADICDQADIQQQTLLDAMIKKSRDNVVSIEGSGLCLACGHAVSEAHVKGKAMLPRWCCVECRDVWDKDN